MRRWRFGLFVGELCRCLEFVLQFLEAALKQINLLPLRDNHLTQIGDRPFLLGDTMLELGDAERGVSIAHRYLSFLSSTFCEI